MANVLITGAGGFLGTWLCRVFVGAGHRVRATDVPQADFSAAKKLGAETIGCDVADAAKVAAAVKDQDVVVHAAGIFDLAADPDRLWRVNAEGARAIARAAASAGAKRFVMISTTGVYGRGGTRVREDAPKTPRNPYERSKWAGERMAIAECERAGLPSVVLRPTLIYGPLGRYGIATWIAIFSLHRARGSGALRVAPGGPLGHHVHAEDVARAAELLAFKDGVAGSAFNVADDAPIDGGEMIRAVASACGLDVRGRAIPWWVARQLARARSVVSWWLDDWNPKLAYLWAMLVAEKGLEPELRPRVDLGWVDYLTHDYSYDNARLKELGFRFKHPDVRAGIAETVAWYRAERWIP